MQGPCTPASVSMHMCACDHTSLDNCVYVDEYMCMHTFNVHLIMHTLLYGHLCAGMCVCMYVQVCVSACTHLFPSDDLFRHTVLHCVSWLWMPLTGHFQDVRDSAMEWDISWESVKHGDCEDFQKLTTL